TDSNNVFAGYPNDVVREAQADVDLFNRVNAVNHVVIPHSVTTLAAVHNGHLAQLRLGVCPDDWLLARDGSWELIANADAPFDTSVWTFAPHKPGAPPATIFDALGRDPVDIFTENNRAALQRSLRSMFGCRARGMPVPEPEALQAYLADRLARVAANAPLTPHRFDLLVCSSSIVFVTFDNPNHDLVPESTTNPVVFFASREVGYLRLVPRAGIITPPPTAALFAEYADGLVRVTPSTHVVSIGDTRLFSAGDASREELACREASAELFEYAEGGGVDTYALQAHARGLDAIATSIADARGLSSRKFIVIGETGAGKSTVINKLLGSGRCRLLPQCKSPGTSTTFVRTDISYAPDNYSLDVTLITADMLHEEAHAYAAIMAERPDEQDQTPADAAVVSRVSRLFRGDPAGRIYIDAVCNMVASTNNANDCDNDEEDVAASSSTPASSSSRSLTSLLADTQAYRELEDLRAARPAPIISGDVNDIAAALLGDDVRQLLIHRVVITGPFPLLASGATIVDLPGLNDVNAARHRDAMAVLDAGGCHAVYVVRGGISPTAAGRDLAHLIAAAPFLSITLVATHIDSKYNDIMDEIGDDEPNNVAAAIAVSNTLNAMRDLFGDGVMPTVNDELSRHPDLVPPVYYHAVACAGMLGLARDDARLVTVSAELAGLPVDMPVSSDPKADKAAAAIVDAIAGAVAAAGEAFRLLQATDLPNVTRTGQQAATAALTAINPGWPTASEMWASARRDGEYAAYPVANQTAELARRQSGPGQAAIDLLAELGRLVMAHRVAICAAAVAAAEAVGAPEDDPAASSSACGGADGGDGDGDGPVVSSFPTVIPDVRAAVESSLDRCDAALLRLHASVTRVPTLDAARSQLQRRMSADYAHCAQLWGQGVQPSYRAVVSGALARAAAREIPTWLYELVARRSTATSLAIDDIIANINDVPANITTAIVRPSIRGSHPGVRAAIELLRAGIGYVGEGVPDADLANQFEASFDGTALQCEYCHDLLADPQPLAPSRTDRNVLDQHTQKYVDPSTVELFAGEIPPDAAIDALLAAPAGQAWLASQHADEFRRRRLAPLPAFSDNSATLNTDVHAVSAALAQHVLVDAATIAAAINALAAQRAAGHNDRLAPSLYRLFCLALALKRAYVNAAGIDSDLEAFRVELNTMAVSLQQVNATARYVVPRDVVDAPVLDLDAA
ncbi:uncharacterized protein AMSG_11481, partial [Thecamonas trahens ATCC 50062]